MDKRVWIILAGLLICTEARLRAQQNPTLTITKDPANAGQATISWTGDGVLEKSDALGLAALFQAAPLQSNPQIVSIDSGAAFYRVSIPVAGAWAPPIGIPYPVFGITNTHWMYTNSIYKFDYGAGLEAYHTNEFGPYTQFIDNTHPAATDDNNPLGTPTRPRRTWVYPLPTGSLVQVHGGPYSFANSNGGKLAFGGTGTEAAPIFMYGTSTNQSEMPTITRDEFYTYGNWTVFERFYFPNETIISTRPLLKGGPVTNLCVRDCILEGRGQPSNLIAFTTGGASGNSASDYTLNWLIWRNVAHEYGDWQGTSENDASGVIASQFATNIWILDNAFYHFGGDGIRIGADEGGTPSGGFYYVGRNHIYDNHENAIDVKQARTSVLSENVMHGFAQTSSSAGEAVVVHYNPQNIWFLNNTIYDSERGINSTGVGTDCYIIGNVIYNCSERGLYLDRGGQGTYHVMNNTIDHCANGIITTGSITALRYANNIVSDITQTGGYHLEIDNASIADASTAANFLFFQSNGNVRINWGGTTFTSPTLWLSATGKGTGSIVQNPAFVDSAHANYHLSAGSPAIDAGVSILNYDDIFKTTFGVSILRDFDSNPRPVGAAWDIGADEFVAPTP